MEIIYIAGDGRSGSTLLDSILSNIEQSLSVGECHRFWVRFYEGETHCGCGSKIDTCELWNAVDKSLKRQFPSYDPIAFEKQVREIQFFKHFSDIPELIETESWKPFCNMVVAYYKAIANISGKEIIVDSSKSISWGRLLQELDFCKIRILHLERELPAVANSWKKDVVLPEYKDRKVMMPKKSNALIVKSWLKIKWMARSFRREDYLFLRYEEFCKSPEDKIATIESFLGKKIHVDQLKVYPNHAIGGNPMRSRLTSEIRIKSPSKEFKNLNILERLGFSIIHNLAKLL